MGRRTLRGATGRRWPAAVKPHQLLAATTFPPMKVGKEASSKEEGGKHMPMMSSLTRFHDIVQRARRNEDANQDARSKKDAPNI